MWIVVAVLAVVAVPIGVLVWSPGTQNAGQICAGQCGPPWHVEVMFNKGVTATEANSAVKRCEHAPDFISASAPIRRPGSFQDLYITTIETRTWDSAEATQLSDCLHRSPAVGGVGVAD